MGDAPLPLATANRAALLAARAGYRRIGILVAALLLTSCVGEADSANTGKSSSTSSAKTGSGGGVALEHTPTPIPGLESCEVLTQRPSRDVTGDRMPRLRLPCLTPGPDVELSALRGRPMLVNLWATWCAPCREEMPLLQENYERYGSQVQFLGVDTKDGTAPAVEFLADTGVTYPQVVDGEGDLLGHFRVPGLPVTVVLDRDGRIAGKHIGQLRQTSIDELLAKVR